MNTVVSSHSLWHRLQVRMAASRFLTFSLLIHAIIVILGSGVVIATRLAPDFPSNPVGTALAEQDIVQPPQTEAEPSIDLAPALPTLHTDPIDIIKVDGPSAVAAVLPPMPSVGTQLSDSELHPKITVQSTPSGIPAEFKWRSAAGRAERRRINDGTTAAEKAVLAGLRWLKDHQNEDGSWSDDFRSAMTGFALLSFLGHGELPQAPEFGPTVKRGLDWLLAQGMEFHGRLSLTRDGWGSNYGVYEHAIATYALGEYFSMTHDERFAELLQQSVGFIVQGQAPDGGWQYNYAKGPDSDTSVSGWQIQALKAAHLTGLQIPGVDEALDKAMLDLKRVQGEDGSYGYRKAGDRDFSLDGVGVLCTYFWKQDKDKGVREGIEHMLRQTENKHQVKYKGDSADLYAWYYDTQACLMFGGGAWNKWNRLFQGELVAAQSSDGSWPPCGGQSPGSELQRRSDGAGPCYRTTLCVLMLEVFYRTMPVTKG